MKNRNKKANQKTLARAIRLVQALTPIAHASCLRLPGFDAIMADADDFVANLRKKQNKSFYLPPHVAEILNRVEALRRTVFYINSFNLGKRTFVLCRYCKSHLEFSEFTVDHVTARSLGGTDEISNLVCACGNCNARKGKWESIEISLSRCPNPRKSKKIKLEKLKLEWAEFVEGNK